MEEVGLIEAWGNWAQGEMNLEAQLWGMSILWWGRIGKLTGFAAALAIIAEIIGPERLRAFGDTLHGVITPKRCLKFVTDVLGFLEAFTLSVIFCVTRNKEKEAAADAKMESYQVGRQIRWAALLVLAGTWIALSMASFFQDKSWLAFIGAILLGYVVSVLAALFALVVFALFLATGGLLLALVDRVVLDNVAWLLERKHLDKLIKIASAVLLIVGFHFDLLAS